MKDKLGSMDMQSNKWEETNWAVYQKRYPDSTIRDQHGVTLADVEILYSRSGIPTMRATTKSGHKVFFHSSVDPVKEAQRTASALEVQAGTVAVVYGLGLGYLVDALLKQLNERIHLFVIEPDLNAFQMVMKTRDLRHILASERVHLQVGNSIINLGSHFFSFYDVSRFNNIIITGLLGHQNVYSDFYMESMKVIKQAMNAAVMELRNIAKNGYDIVLGTIANFADYCTNPGVNSLYGKYAGVPAIIVAAGPSLDTNIALLHEAKGRAVIIAVGTALKALQQHGIDPDFVVSIDAGSINIMNFSDHNNEKTALLADIQSHPMVLQDFKGPIFISTLQSFITSWSEGLVEDKGGLETGGTVANSAMTAAYKIGANPIILVGQDLAFARDGHTHASGTIYGDVMSAENENSEHFYVTANDGGQVLTDRVLDYFRQFFEAWIEVNSDRTYINATEGGAFIAGTQIMTLQEVLHKYCQEPIDVQSVIIQAQQECCTLSKKEALALLYRRLADVDRILEVVTSVVKMLKKLQQACDKRDPNKINKYASNINKTFKQFEEDPFIRPAVEILAHHTIHHITYRRNEALYADDNDVEKAVTDYDIYYKKIYEEVKRVKYIIEGVIKRTEDRFGVNTYV